MSLNSIAQKYFSHKKWLISPEGMQNVVTIFEARASGEKLTAEEREELKAQRRHLKLMSAEDFDEVPDLNAFLYGPQSEMPSSSAGGTKYVAIVPLLGPVFARAGWLEICGYVDPHTLASQIESLADNPNVHSIILHVDSPGGTVAGTRKAAEAIFQARKKKRMVAVVDDGAFSAAYWIASQADEVILVPGAAVGSIGVIATHVDYTVQAEQKGMKITYVRSVPGKALGQPYEAMDDVVRADWERDLNSIHTDFATDISRGRNIPLEEAQALATGQIWYGQDAIDQHLADRIATLSDILNEEVSSISSSSQSSKKRGQKKGSTVSKEEMDKLKEENPALYAAIIARGQQEGTVLAQARVAKALAVENPDDLTDERLGMIGRQAKDGEAYRTSLLDRLKKEAVRLYGAEKGEKTGNRLAATFANASIKDLEEQVSDLAEQADAAVPDGKKSKEQQDQGNSGSQTEQSAAPNWDEEVI